MLRRRTFLFILSLLAIEEKAEIVIFVNGNFSLGKQKSPLKRHTEGAIKNEQSRQTGNIGYTRRRKTKQKTQHNIWPFSRISQYI